MENIADERTVDRITNYIKSHCIQLFGEGSINNTTSCIKIKQLFVKNDEIDQEAVEFFSQSLFKWKKMNASLSLLCGINIQGQKARRELIIYKNSKITQEFKQMWLNNSFRFPHPHRPLHPLRLRVNQVDQQRRRKRRERPG